MLDRWKKALLTKEIALWVALALLAWLIPFPFRAWLSGTLLAPPILEGISGLYPKSTMRDLTRLIRNLGGPRKVGYPVLGMYIVSMGLFLFSLNHKINPIFLFLIGLFCGLSLGISMGITPVVYHWEEWVEELEKQESQK